MSSPSPSIADALDPTTIGPQPSKRRLLLAHDVGGKSIGGASLRMVLDAPDADEFLEIPCSGLEVVTEACEVGTHCEPAMRGLSDDSLIDILLTAAQKLSEDQQLPNILVRETGKTISEARTEIASASRILRHYAGSIPEASRGWVDTSSSNSVWGMVVPEPVGLCVLVLPWNLPVQILAHKLGAALSARCPAIVKPSPQAPMSTHHLVAAFRGTGLPDGAVSIVHGGNETVHALLRDPHTRMASFTGGTGAGREVRISAATSGIRLITELGGKSPNIVLDDADLDAATDAILSGLVRNQGATCTAPTRLLVARTVMPEIRELLSRKLRDLVPGDPFLDDSKIGALRGFSEAKRIQTILSHARKTAVSVEGGDIVEVPGRTGAYMLPAIAWEPPSKSDLVIKELFAPILTVEVFERDGDGPLMANSSDYGLSAGVWSSNIERARKVSAALRTGTVHINHYGRKDSIALPSSGRGSSGIGAEGGFAGIREFQEQRAIHIAKEISQHGR